MSYIGNTQQNQSYVPAVDFFNGNGSTTAFTLSKPVASVAQIQAVINNVPQKPGDAYTVSGSTITFTSAPPSGSNNIYVYYTSPNTYVMEPGQGTVGTSKLQSDLTLTNPSYTGTFTGSSGVINIGSGHFYKDASGNVGIGTSSPSTYGKLAVSGGKLGVYSNAEYAILDTSATNAAYLQMNYSGTTYGFVGQASALISSGLSAGDLTARSQGNLLFATGGANERMRIDTSGNLLVGTTSNYASGNLQGIAAQASGNACLALSRTSDTGAVARFYSTSTLVGRIEVTGSATSYVTSSDYRLKENIQPMQNALGVVAQLNPVTYTWKVDGSDGQGFIAHELQAVVPDCVCGEKDAVDAEGNPVYQGIDTSFLVATLTKAIQELKAEVDDLKAQLKGAA